MTVAELRAALEGHPDDRAVVVWEDGDGTRGASLLSSCREALMPGGPPAPGLQGDICPDDDQPPADAAAVVLLSAT